MSEFPASFMAMIVPREPRPACGRPTVSGLPCKRGRMTTDPLVYDYLPPSCAIHATKEEHAEVAKVNAESRERGRAFRRSLPVACWEWEVAPAHRDRSAETAACADRADAFNMATDLLDDWQDDRCAACGKRNGAEYLDHDHETGLIRGYLCRFCNGKEAGDYEPGGRYDRYRGKNPATILGISVPYWSRFTGWAEPAPTIAERERLANHAAHVLAAAYQKRRDG